MKHIITGYKGLIGSHLRKRIGIGNLEVDRRDPILGLELKDLDHIANRADILYHLAAHCRINESIETPEQTFKDNVEGVFKVLEFCRKHEIPKIVVFSSSRVLYPEENPYTASKKYAENLAEAYHQCYGLEYLIVRPTTVYGPGEDQSNRLMHKWIEHAKKGEDLVINGDQRKTLSFTYIDDFLDGLQIAMDRLPWNKAYDIFGTEENLTKVAKEIIRQTKSRSQIVYKDPEIAQPQKVGFDGADLRKVGYLPKINIKEGIKRCLM